MLESILVPLYGGHPIASAVVALTVAGATLLYYLYQRNLSKCQFHLERWDSYEISKGVRCNKAIKDGKLMETLDHKIKGEGLVQTVYDCFMHGIEVSKDGPCLGRLVDNLTRFEWQSYRHVKEQAEVIGKMLRSNGVLRQQCVGIYGANSCEWLIAELACQFQSFATVPLYDTLGLDSIRHTIREVEMPVLFCDSEDRLKPILAEIESFPALKVFVLLHDQVKSPEFVEQYKANGVDCLTWSQAKSLGMQHPEIWFDPPNPEDIFLVQYTSGTTGISKGAIITHRNMVACIAGAEKWAHTTCPKEALASREVNANDSNLMYLPLAHIYAQNSTVWFFYVGGSIAFPSGSIQRLTLEAQLMKPTYFPLIPRIMNRVYSKALDETKSGLKGWLFWKCYERKRELFRKGILTKSSIYDWLVFRKLQKLIGGNVRIMTAGSAPIAAEVIEFWRVVFGALIFEGYGQTESCCISTGSIREGGCVGHPSCSVMIRLLDVPELGYSVENDPPQGEICIKGAPVMQGYFKRPELTNEAFTDDGWLMTGDVGEFLPNGTLRIIDRRKNIFKLSQGEYIAPEKVESVYMQCPLIGQVFVDGDSLETYVVAIVVPDEIEAQKWAGDSGLEHSSLKELCCNADFRIHILNAMTKVGKEKRLNSLEQVKSIHLEPEQFSISNGLLTPSMKNKRNDLRRRFKGEIEELYKAGPMIAANSGN